MKWLGNLPVPVPSAWNVLCDAVYERLTFYRITGEVEKKIIKLPEVPHRRDDPWKMADVILKMRGVLKMLIDCSFERENFGKWCTLATPEQLIVPDDPRFARWNIDGCAYFMTPGYFPCRRYRTTDFIHAAAAVLNEAVRYPLPSFIVNPKIRNGFFINGDLRAEDFENGETLSGTVAEDFTLRSYKNDRINQIGDQLANWYKGSWRGRTSNYRWNYRPGRNELPYSTLFYSSPELRGSGKIRSKMLITDGHDNQAEKFSGNLQEFTMNFSSGTADKEIVFPDKVVQAARDTWNGSEGKYHSRTVHCKLEQKEVLLTENNFPELPYTYME